MNLTITEWKRRLFEAFHGHWDPQQALQDGVALDPTMAHFYMDKAIYKQLTADYRAWVRSHLKEVDRNATSAEGERLFTVDPKVDLRSMRSTVVLDGNDYALDSLSGPDGVAVLRAVAARDEKQAKTMLSRSSLARRLADAIEAASEKAGRPVTVAEVIGDKAA